MIIGQLAEQLSMEIAKKIALLVERFDIDLQVVWKRMTMEEISFCDVLFCQ